MMDPDQQERENIARHDREQAAPIDGDWTWNELEDVARGWYADLTVAEQEVKRLRKELEEANWPYQRDQEVKRLREENERLNRQLNRAFGSKMTG